MVGVASVDIPSMNQIEPGSPADSYVWHKMNGTHSSVGGSGSTMPLGSSVSQADLDLIEAWIYDGAMQ